VQSGAALVAHHQDDADENRLAELGKGNILHIDGMAMSSTMFGVEVIRPLLPVRKAALIAFADAAPICYMQDSTPRWSRRGWTRKVLDDICTHESGEHAPEKLAQHTHLLEQLTQVGAASDTLGNAVDASLRDWKAKSVESAILHVPFVAAGSDMPPIGSKKKKKDKQHKDAVDSHPVATLERCSQKPIEVVILWLPEIVELANEFEPRLAALHADIGEVADVWNAAIDSQSLPQEEYRAVDHVDDSLDVEDADCSNDSPGSCPLQRITVHRAGGGVGPFLFSRAIYAVSNDCMEMQKRLQGQPVARKALAHLWDSIVRARLEYQWGSLHKGCPCLYLRDRCCLVLPDAEGHEGVLTDRQWQREFARTALEFTQRSMRQHYKASQ